MLTAPLTLPGEEWRPIPGYEGLYMASNLGRIRSLERLARVGGGGFRTVTERILSGRSHRYGYTSYVLRKDGESHPYHGHVLVMRAFVGLPDEGLVICHNDSDGSNNRLDNLRYDTVKSNSADSIEIGTSLRGERHPKVKLTEKEVLVIRERRAAGDKPVAIARDYDVDVGTISCITTGKIWAWADGPITIPEPKMTDVKVVELRHRRAAGESVSALATEYGISRIYASKICFGSLWVDAGGPLTKSPATWRKNRAQESNNAPA